MCLNIICSSETSRNFTCFQFLVLDFAYWCLYCLQPHKGFDKAGRELGEEVDAERFTYRQIKVIKDAQGISFTDILSGSPWSLYSNRTLHCTTKVNFFLNFYLNVMSHKLSSFSVLFPTTFILSRENSFHRAGIEPKPFCSTRHVLITWPWLILLKF